MKPLILRPIQQPMLDFLVDVKRPALWASMGSGKTSAVLCALDALKILGEVGNAPTLVIGPMRVARDTWPDEVVKWENFKDLKIVSLASLTPEERKDQLKRKADIFTINYELLPWLVGHYMERWPFRQVIADESDRLKGFREKRGDKLKSDKTGASGLRAYSIARVAHTLVDRWVNLTGTPAPNGLKDLWGQTWYQDRGERLGRTHTAFMQRWFQRRWSGYGVAPMPHAEKEIHAALGDICLTVDAKDYFDLQEPNFIKVPVKLPKRARELYKKLEREMFIQLEEGGVEAFNAAALTNKCLQMANGAVYTDYPKWAQVHDEKIEALKSIQSESGGTPLLVAYSFKSDVARLLKAFPGSVELSTAAGMKKFKAGDAPVGLAHPASMGHGIDGLQKVSNILVRFGHSWNLGETMQMLERIGPMRQLQAGFSRPVLVYDLVCEDTLDEDVIAATAAKRSAQDSLLLAMNRRRNVDVGKAVIG